MTDREDRCTCWITDPATWDYPLPGYGAEPSSQWEQNPDCPAHPLTPYDMASAEVGDQLEVRLDGGRRFRAEVEHVGEDVVRVAQLPWKGDYRPIASALVPTAIPSHHDVEHEVGRPCSCAERGYPCSCVEDYAFGDVAWTPALEPSPSCLRHGGSFGAALGRVGHHFERMFAPLLDAIGEFAERTASAWRDFRVVVDEAVPKVRERKKDRLAREARELQERKAARAEARAAQRGGQR